MTFGELFQFVMGIYTGIILMAALSGLAVSIVIKRMKTSPEIREISESSLDIFLKEKKIKNKMTKSLMNELKKVSKLANPESKNALFDLSINEAIKAINMVQFKLRRLVDNALFRPFRNLTLTQILNLEDVVKKPLKVYNSKPMKILMKLWSYFMIVWNILSPMLWVRRLLKLTLFKRGKKDLIVLGYDYCGNLIYDIYNHSKE